MPEAAKRSVRAFLNFDLSRPKDIFVQDQLTWGTIDGGEGGLGGGTSVLIVQRAALDEMSPEFVNQLEVMSARDGAAAAGRGAHGSTPTTPMSKQNSAKDSDNTSVLSLQNLIWETATEGGGASLKKPLNKHHSVGSSGNGLLGGGKGDSSTLRGSLARRQSAIR